MYDAPTAIKRCEEFLLEKSKMAMSSKLKLSARYGLYSVMEKNLSGINTLQDLRSIIPADLPEKESDSFLVFFKKNMDL